MWPADPNWQMSLLFLLALACLGFVMKLVTLILPATAQVDRPHLFWLLLSPTSFRRLRPVLNVPHLLFRTALVFGAAVLGYWVYWQFVHAFHIRGVFLGYCAAPVLLLVTETLVAIASLLWLPSGRLLPPLHHRLAFAKSVADFWGHRWNLWFSDWFRYAIFWRLRQRPLLALVLVFAVSGLMHEWVINVPLYFLTGQACFGSMMIYFLLQAGGVLLERRFSKRYPCLRIIFAWLVVLVPIPLIINEGLLRVLHLWPQQDEVVMSL